MQTVPHNYCGLSCGALTCGAEWIPLFGRTAATGASDGVDGVVADLPENDLAQPSSHAFELNAYPNPFSTAVTIEYTAPEVGSKMTIVALNAIGQVVYHDQYQGVETQSTRGDHVLNRSPSR